jgi:hypothetical protein
MVFLNREQVPLNAEGKSERRLRLALPDCCRTVAFSAEKRGGVHNNCLYRMVVVTEV